CQTQRPRPLSSLFYRFALFPSLIVQRESVWAGGTHSLKYFYTASSGIKGFPEFVTVGCEIKREVPKQDWMDKVSDGDAQYWEEQTQVSLGDQQTYKANIEIAKQRLNQTGGSSFTFLFRPTVLYFISLCVSHGSESSSDSRVHSLTDVPPAGGSVCV
uniref:MHC class I-like antigen recognition-like domain-containing protein n=1 Tax=Neogobius melanostomus TaxID=47308 RepID=A0A8C6UC08_9GOBI